LDFSSAGSSILWELHWSLMELNGASWELPAHAAAQQPKIFRRAPTEFR
jgi:hypothetical protein